MNSSTFCVLPFIHFSTNSSGNFRLCCYAQPLVDAKENKIKPSADNSIEKLWNSPEIRAARMALATGDKIPACHRCWNHEEKGMESHRLRENRRWLNEKTRALIEDSLQNSGHVAKPPVYFDIRLHNVCNLKCRSCNPIDSNLVQQEWKNLNFTPESRRLNETFRVDKEWQRSNDYTEMLKLQIPNMQEVYITGGEPSVSPAALEIFESLVAEKRHEAVRLRMNTNAHQISDRFLATLSQFKYLNIDISIDAIGKAAEFLRYPCSWDQIEKNVLRMGQQLPQAQLKIAITPSAFNVFLMKETLEWSLEMKKAIPGLTATTSFAYPAFLSIEALPLNVRQSAMAKLGEIISEDKFQPLQVEAEIHRLINILNDTSTLDPERTIELQRYTRDLDKARNQRLSDGVPTFDWINKI